MSVEPQHSSLVIPGTGKQQQQLVCTRKVLSESKSGVVGVVVAFRTAKGSGVIQNFTYETVLESVLCIGFSLSLGS